MRYAIVNPDRGKWDVYEADKYEAVSKAFNVLDDKELAQLNVALDCIRVRRYKTRSSARAYVTEVLGGTY